MRRVIVPLFLLLVFPISTPAETTVDISDSNLRAAIREALNIARGAPISREDIHRLTHLYADNRGIINLSGLEAATNLETLSLGENPLRNVSPLAYLINLRILVLRNCQINDINSLAPLAQLEVLIMHDNRVGDIGSLAGCTQLTELNARNNPISDLTPLAHLTQSIVFDLTYKALIWYTSGRKYERGK